MRQLHVGLVLWSAWGALLAFTGCAKSHGPPELATMSESPATESPELDPEMTDCQGCVIDGRCIAADVVDPAFPQCQVCDPTENRVGLSPATGTACDDGVACTVDDVCVRGRCEGGAQVCEAEPTCEGCRIDGRCVPNGAHHPQLACQFCDRRRSSLAWSLIEGRCEPGCEPAIDCSSGQCKMLPSASMPCGVFADGCLLPTPCPDDACLGEERAPEGASCDTDGDLGTLEACDGLGGCQRVSGWHLAEPIELHGPDYVATLRLSLDGQGHAAAIWDGESSVDPTIYSVWASDRPRSGPWSKPVALNADDPLRFALPGYVQLFGHGEGLALFLRERVDQTQGPGPLDNLGVWFNRFDVDSGWSPAELAYQPPVGAAYHVAGSQIGDGGVAALFGTIAASASGQSSGMRAAFYEPSAGWQTSTVLADGHGGTPAFPQVKHVGNGALVVAWQEFRADRPRIWVVSYSPAVGWGTPLPMEIEGGTDAGEFDLAGSEDGSALLVSTSVAETGQRAVWAARYMHGRGWAAPQWLGKPVTVAEPVQSDLNGVPLLRPLVVMGATTGRGQVAWSQWAGEALGVYSTAYDPLTGFDEVEHLATVTGRSDVWVDVAVNDDGTAMVAWAEDGHLWTRRRQGAEPWTNPVSVPGTELGVHGVPVLEMNGTGLAMLAWRRYVDDAYTLWSSVWH